MIKPEILAPAGSPQALIAAVRSGADAVYLGIKNLTRAEVQKILTMSSLKKPLHTVTNTT